MTMREITEAVIPPPIFMQGTALRRQLQELGAPLEAIIPGHNLRLTDVTVPDQQLNGQQLLVNVTIHHSTTKPVEEAPAPDRQLTALEALAKAEPALRHHRMFWQALRDAKAGRRLVPRQQQILQLAWQRLRRRAAHRPPALRQQLVAPRVRHFQQQALAATTPRSYRAELRLQGGAALGHIQLAQLNAQPGRRADKEILADLEPFRSNWMPKLRPSFSDTDSGDEH